MQRYRSQIIVVLGLFLAILIAVFAFIGGVKVEVEVTIVPSEAGEVEGEGRYGSGKEVTIKAIANPGYIFYEWRKRGERFATEPEHSFQIWERKRLEAQFMTVEEVIEDLIAVSAEPSHGGTVSAEPYEAHPSKITLSANPEENFEFTGWIIDGEVIKTNMVYVADIHKEKEIIASFEEKEE